MDQKIRSLVEKLTEIYISLNEDAYLDNLSKVVLGLGYTSEYVQKEALTMIKDELQNMKAEVDASMKGTRVLLASDIGGGFSGGSVQRSTFPSYINKLKLGRDTFNSAIRGGRSKVFPSLVDTAIKRLEHGYKEANHGYDEPSKEFIKILIKGEM